MKYWFFLSFFAFFFLRFFGYPKPKILLKLHFPDVCVCVQLWITLLIGLVTIKSQSPLKAVPVNTRSQWIEYISLLRASDASLFSFSSFNSVTVFMITEAEAAFIGICLEGFLFGKMISVLCCSLLEKSNYSQLLTRSPIIHCSRNLFRNIRHVSTFDIGKFHWQDANNLLCSLGSLHSINCFRCQWFRRWPIFLCKY